MTDITALKTQYVEVDTFEEVQERATLGWSQVMITNVGGKTVHIMAPSDTFVDDNDRVAQGIEFANWFTNRFNPDTANVVPEPAAPMIESVRDVEA